MNNVFFFQFCYVTKVAIFHKLVWPILVIQNIKGKFLTFLFIFGYLLELCLEISQSFSDFFSIFGFFFSKNHRICDNFFLFLAIM
jgi:hypothetical protein